jgi:hypothetical protein
LRGVCEGCWANWRKWWIYGTEGMGMEKGKADC